MGSTLAKEKMRSFIASSKKRVAGHRSAAVRNLSVITSAIEHTAVIEQMEKRVLFTVAGLPTWTFESLPGTVTAGPYAPEVNGNSPNAASAFHAGASTYSAPAGNGSAKSYSSNLWAVGDYYQFLSSSTGETISTVSFDDVSSGTGPADFKVQYSLNGTSFSDVPSSNFTIPSGYSFSATTPNSAASHSFDVSSLGLSGLANIGFRVVDVDTTSVSGGTVGTGGTSRIDNFSIAGSYTSPGSPVVGTVTASPLTVGAGSGTPVTLSTTAYETPGNSAISGVTFYREAQIGTETPATDPSYTGVETGISTTYTASVPTAGLNVGNYVYYAVATDNATPAASAASPAAQGATNTVTVAALPNVSFSAPNYNINETGGTVTITATISAAPAANATVAYSVTDGTHFAAGQVDGAAVLGRDYSAPSGTGTLTFTPTGALSQTFTIPILTPKTFAGTRVINLTLSNPNAQVVLGSAFTSMVTITDNTVSAPNGIDTPSSEPSYSSAPNVTSSTLDAGTFLPISSSSSNGFGSGSNVGPNLAYLEFSPSTTLTSPTYTVATVDSVKLSLYNTATTGSFAGQPGNFDLFLLNSTSSQLASPTILYSANGSTGAAAIGGTDNAATMLGKTVFTNNQAGFNDFIFDLSGAGQTLLTQDLNTGVPVRFVVVPDSTNPAAADWDGESTNSSYTAYNPKVTLLAEEAATPVETVNLDTSTLVTPVNKGGSEVVTIDRTSSSDLLDTPTVSYSLSGTAVIGTDYTSSTNTSTGSVQFTSGAASTSITFQIPQTALSGDKQFTFTITGVSVGNGRIGRLGSPLAETVTIHDSRTTNISNNADVTASVGTNATAGASSVNINGTGFIDIIGTGNGATNQSFGVLDYNTPGGGDNYTLNTGNVVDSIQGISLVTVIDNFHLVAGPLNVYVVPDSTTVVDGTNTSLKFDTTQTGTAGASEGLGSQLGVPAFLGTVPFAPGQPANSFVATQLTNLNATTALTLLADINKGLKFRIVITPGSTAVGAAFYSNAYATIDGVMATYETPKLAFNVVQSPLPGWLSPNSVATFNEQNETLSVTGAATIIGDPAAYGDGSVAISVTGGGSLGTGFSTANNAIHIGSLSVTGGSSVKLGNTAFSDKNILLTSALTIDSTSYVDVGDGYMDLQGGAASGALFPLVKKGFANGAWNGLGGIDSSAAAALHTTALGLRAATTTGTLDGAAYSIGDALLKYTFFGDADLSGHVDGSDYTRIDSAFVTGGVTGWFNGDFNYDGVINGSDYTLIDNAFNMEGTTVIAAQVAKPAPETKPAATPTAQVAITSTDSLFSKKKVSLFEELEQEITGS